MTNNLPSLISYDCDQIRIITASANERILVDAGPGTGKTAVACARVSWLIDNYGVNPSHIWFISFTRTAVQEIRNRIQYYLKNPIHVNIIKIATIDSSSWIINQGFDEGPGVIGTEKFPSYEENIDKVRKLLEKTDIGKQIVHNIDHLIIDEAQDIIGFRAKLLLTLISQLKKNCGVTVFSDDAQSIYGFAIDEEKKTDKILAIPLPQSIRTFFHSDFNHYSLNKVYRTESAVLLKIFTEVRQDVLNNKTKSREKIKKIKDVLLSSSQELDSISEQQFDDPDNTFVLYRRRAEVLTASSFLEHKPHRIRMSGIPQSIHPWVGLCLSEFTSKSLKKSDFFSLWDEAISKCEKLIKKKSDNQISYFDFIGEEGAWDLLYRLAGSKNSVDMTYLRQKLGSVRPPYEVISPEIGQSGPIIGTIHASKGREADYVHLMIPNTTIRKNESDDTIDEETRVHFVGATRARKDLKVGKGYVLPRTDSLDSGRVFRILNNNGGINLEIGRTEDITAECIAGIDLFSDSVLVSKNQLTMIKNGSKIKGVKGENNKDLNKYSLIYEDSNKPFAFLSDSVKWDMKSIINSIKKNSNNKYVHYPKKINYLKSFGIRTLVLPKGEECQDLHDPWSDSGFMIAPVIFGFSHIYIHH